MAALSKCGVKVCKDSVKLWRYGARGRGGPERSPGRGGTKGEVDYQLPTTACDWRRACLMKKLSTNFL
jgi:hypothetical protein